MKSKILPIAGDASFRTFYRLILNKSSKIIVFANKEKYKNQISALRSEMKYVHESTNKLINFFKDVN